MLQQPFAAECHILLKIFCLHPWICFLNIFPIRIIRIFHPVALDIFSGDSFPLCCIRILIRYDLLFLLVIFFPEILFPLAFFPGIFLPHINNGGRGSRLETKSNRRIICLSLSLSDLG